LKNGQISSQLEPDIWHIPNADSNFEFSCSENDKYYITGTVFYVSSNEKSNQSISLTLRELEVFDIYKFNPQNMFVITAGILVHL